MGTVPAREEEKERVDRILRLAGERMMPWPPVAVEGGPRSWTVMWCPRGRKMAAAVSPASPPPMMKMVRGGVVAIFAVGKRCDVSVESECGKDIWI